MAIKLRRVIIAARFRNPGSDDQVTPQETQAVLAARAATGTRPSRTAKLSRRTNVFTRERENRVVAIR